MIRILDNQSFCLTKFLYNKYGNDNVIGISAPNEIKNEETATLDYYSVSWRNNNYVFRWDWEKTKTPEQNLLMESYKENTPEFEQLEECNTFSDKERSLIF